MATWHGSGLNEEESWRNGRGTEPMPFVPLLARSVPDREGIRISRLPIDVVALVPLLSHAARQGRRRRRADAGDLAVAGRIFLLSLSIYRLHGIDPRRPRTKGTVAARLPAVGLFCRFGWLVPGLLVGCLVAIFGGSEGFARNLVGWLVGHRTVRGHPGHEKPKTEQKKPRTGTEPKPRSSVPFRFLVLRNRSARFGFGFYSGYPRNRIFSPPRRI